MSVFRAGDDPGRVILLAVGWAWSSSDEASARARLCVRHGDEIDRWLDGAPDVLAALGERWGLRFERLVPAGSTSLVVRCARAADGRAAVLKLSPDRGRLAREAEALATWATPHVPSVYAVDATVGALLIEAIEPGAALGDTGEAPSLPEVGALVEALHAAPTTAGTFPPLSDLVARLFESWVRPRQLHPELVELVADDLFDRSRRYASRLAEDVPLAALLHGDLTPVNVLDGGERGLVAIDPSPCLGDPAYDAIDLLVWQVDDVATIEARAATLAPAAGVEAARVLDWCVAFGAMFVLDLAGPGQRHAPDWPERAAPLLALASRVPR